MKALKEKYNLIELNNRDNFILGVTESNADLFNISSLFNSNYLETVYPANLRDAINENTENDHMLTIINRSYYNGSEWYYISAGEFKRIEVDEAFEIVETAIIEELTNASKNK